MLAHDQDAVLVERILAEIANKKTAISRNIAAGECETMERYRYLTGQIAGLEATQRFIRDEYKKVNDQ